jgi:hypothetical protein
VWAGVFLLIIAATVRELKWRLALLNLRRIVADTSELRAWRARFQALELASPHRKRPSKVCQRLISLLDCLLAMPAEDRVAAFRHMDLVSARVNGAILAAVVGTCAGLALIRANPGYCLVAAFVGLVLATELDRHLTRGVFIATGASSRHTPEAQ